MAKVVDIGDSPRQRARIVDEAGRLAGKIEKIGVTLAPLVERFASLKKTMTGWAANDPADRTRTVEGKLYEAIITAQDFEREIQNMQAVFDALGQTDFLKHCGFTLKKLDVLVPEAEKLGIVKKERTGPRRVSVSPRQPKQAAA